MKDNKVSITNVEEKKREKKMCQATGYDREFEAVARCVAGEGTAEDAFLLNNRENKTAAVAKELKEHEALYRGLFDHNITLEESNKKENIEINIEDVKREKKMSEAIEHAFSGGLTAKDKMFLRTEKAEHEKFREKYSEADIIEAITGLKVIK